MILLNEPALQRAEMRLALLGEDPRHRFALGMLDLPIAVAKLEAKLPGDLPAHGAFARAHETHKVEIGSRW